MVDYKLDNVDNGILNLLEENSRLKNTEIAEKLGYSEGAIRKRINKLVENNIIEKFSIIV
ncbi:winged helix-turn-helix transcriptional regulator, partial [archaeon]|nr:winged helix-turn-helix transcriptional regulator [archaeon]